MEGEMALTISGIDWPRHRSPTLLLQPIHPPAMMIHERFNVSFVEFNPFEAETSPSRPQTLKSPSTVSVFKMIDSTMLESISDLFASNGPQGLPTKTGAGVNKARQDKQKRDRKKLMRKLDHVAEDPLDDMPPLVCASGSPRRSPKVKNTTRKEREGRSKVRYDMPDRSIKKKSGAARETRSLSRQRQPGTHRVRSSSRDSRASLKSLQRTDHLSLVETPKTHPQRMRTLGLTYHGTSSESSSYDVPFLPSPSKRPAGCTGSVKSRDSSRTPRRTRRTVKSTTLDEMNQTQRALTSDASVLDLSSTVHSVDCLRGGQRNRAGRRKKAHRDAKDERRRLEMARMKSNERFEDFLQVRQSSLSSQ